MVRSTVIPVPARIAASTVRERQAATGRDRKIECPIALVGDVDTCLGVALHGRLERGLNELGPPASQSSRARSRRR